MGEVNFTQFNLKQRTDLRPTDFLVGYNFDGSREFRTTVTSLTGLTRGIQGTQGLSGIQGRQGAPGNRGIDGIQGIQGAQGTQGNQGIQGPQGIQGLDGAYAAIGNQGIQGIQGSQSIQGLQGVQGPAGDGFNGTGTINVTNFPTYRNASTNLIVKNSNYSSLSANIIDETGYWDAQAAYAYQGGLMIKGHARNYASPTNLPGLGGYGIYIQNVDNMDPGITLACDGRANITHGMTFRAGNRNFTAGSDHTHVIWEGAPSNSTRGWQMTMGGDWVTNSTTFNTNRFMVHTLPQFQTSTALSAVSGYLDTLQAGYFQTNTSIITGVKLIISHVEPNNYNLIGVNDILNLTLNPGLGGLIAVAYNSQVKSISSNSVNLSSFDLHLYGTPNLLEAQNKSVVPLNLALRAAGGNPGVIKVASQIGSPSTQYVGLTGNYKNVPKHVFARFTTAQILTGLKTGSPLTVWIPNEMPSNSPVNQGFVTSSRNTAPNVNFRYGYFDAFVKSVSGTDLIFSIGNLMDTYSFENRTWSLTAEGNAGWVIYGGSQDTVHRPTHGTTGFYFEREPYFFNGTNFLSGGTVKNVCLGTSESYGNYSYGLGFRGTVLGDKSATLAGDSNYVYGNNSVAIGGEGLVSTNNNQTVIGKYNDSNTDSLLVVGNGISDLLRSNVFEIKTDGSLIVNSTALSSNGIDTFLKIQDNSGTVYGLKLQLI